MNSNSSSIRRWLVLGSLVTFAFALCVVGARTQQTGTTKTVTITPANPPTVSPDPVEISRDAGDQVDWVCPKCTSGFSVHFPQGTPFTSDSFTNANPNSGRAKADAALQEYHYTVTVGGKTSDPTVIVK